MHWPWPCPCRHRTRRPIIQRLAPVPLGQGRPKWVDDPHLKPGKLLSGRTIVVTGSSFVDVNAAQGE